MADVHRKIELQEPEDLRYLINNARRAANEKLDEHLPRIEGEDPYRKRVEELVHEYITQTFTAASENILINGQEPSTEILETLLSTSTAADTQQIEEFEPLDSKLLAKATELARQEEEMMVEIAGLKRDAHGRAATMWNDSYKAGVEADEEALKNAKSFDDSVDVDLGVGKRQRQEEMEKTWGRGVEALEKLKVEMPGTTAKMERAKRAEEYVLKESKPKR